MSKKNKLMKIFLPLLILAIGGTGMLLLIKAKPAPQHQTSTFQGVLVEVLTLQARPHQVKIKATGTVQANQEITLTPEISGKVAWLSPKLVNGGLFKAGESLLKIEPDDYRLAVERARVEIARAEVALATEEQYAQLALQEWENISLPDKGQPGPLVTHELQLQQEQANLAAARASLKQAELNLQRTEIRAPFNGRIRQESVGLGQYLRAGTPIGTLAGTDQAEVLVPLPVTEMSWLQVPPAGSSKPGSKVLVKRPGEESYRWKGEIVRSLGEIDSASRMAAVIVAVKDPYRLKSDLPSDTLFNGQFVEIVLLGATLDQVIELPRHALREDDTIWLMESDNRLRIVPVEVVRRDPEMVVVRAPLNAGAKLVTSPIPGAADGLLLRVAK